VNAARCVCRFIKKPHIVRAPAGESPIGEKHSS